MGLVFPAWLKRCIPCFVLTPGAKMVSSAADPEADMIQATALAFPQENLVG
jgi:hypothetical protein